MKTLQEIFDTAYLGLAKQGFERSMGHTRQNFVTCAYRGDDGRKCAIGHCIPDDKYEPDFEGENPNNLRVKEAIGDVGASISLLCDLQLCHDRGLEPDLMERLLSQYAAKHGLTIPQIEGAV
jgi:hypothetical protein